MPKKRLKTLVITGFSAFYSFLSVKLGNFSIFMRYCIWGKVYMGKGQFIFTRVKTCAIIRGEGGLDMKSYSSREVQPEV